MKIKRQSAIDYLHKKGYKTGYKKPYTITEKGLIDFMVDFAQEQAGEGQSNIPDVNGSFHYDYICPQCENKHNTSRSPAAKCD